MSHFIVSNQSLYSIIPALADTASKESRAAAYRLLRYTLAGPEVSEKFQEFDLDWYVVR